VLLQVVRAVHWNLAYRVFGILPYQFLLMHRCSPDLFPRLPGVHYSPLYRFVHSAALPLRWLVLRLIVEPGQLLSTYIFLPPKLCPMHPRWRRRIERDSYASSARQVIVHSATCSLLRAVTQKRQI
jgi:hypothetical protein